MNPETRLAPVAPEPRIADLSFCLLTTFDWTGIGVETRAPFAPGDGRLYLQLAASSPAVQRLWNIAKVRVVSCTAAGRPTGMCVDGDARVLGPGQDEAAWRALEGASRRSFGCLGTTVHLDDLLYVEVVPARAL